MRTSGFFQRVSFCFLGGNNMPSLKSFLISNESDSQHKQANITQRMKHLLCVYSWHFNFACRRDGDNVGLTS
jgi:hypothetical protein